MEQADPYRPDNQAEDDTDQVVVESCLIQGVSVSLHLDDALAIVVAAVLSRYAVMRQTCETIVIGVARYCFSLIQCHRRRGLEFPSQIPVTLALSQATTTTGSLTLSWTGNTETDLAGHKVYVGTQPGIYNAPASIGNVTSYTVATLPTGRTYYATITAFDSACNESLHSAEVSKTLN